MAAKMTSCSLSTRVTPVRISQNGVRTVASRPAVPSSSRGQLQIVAARSWKQVAVETAAPLMVALVTLMPASAALAGEPMFNFSQPTPIEMAVDEMPLFSGKLSDESKITIVRAKGNISDDKVKLLYMTLGVGFVYGCCYYGSSSDPFYDTDEYRVDGGDGTAHWFYNADSKGEETSREKLYQALPEASGEWDEFGELNKMAAESTK